MDELAPLHQDNTADLPRQARVQACGAEEAEVLLAATLTEGTAVVTAVVTEEATAVEAMAVATALHPPRCEEAIHGVVAARPAVVDLQEVATVVVATTALLATTLRMEMAEETLMIDEVVEREEEEEEEHLRHAGLHPLVTGTTDMAHRLRAPAGRGTILSEHRGIAPLVLAVAALLLLLAAAAAAAEADTATCLLLAPVTMILPLADTERGKKGEVHAIVESGHQRR